MEPVPIPEVISDEEQQEWFENWWRYGDRDQESVFEDEEDCDGDESDDE